MVHCKISASGKISSSFQVINFTLAPPVDLVRKETKFKAYLNEKYGHGTNTSRIMVILLLGCDNGKVTVRLGIISRLLIRKIIPK